MSAYPHATAAQIDAFRAHGFLVVEDAIPHDDLDELERHCDALILEKEKFAFDWAWDANESVAERSFKIVQSAPELVWPEIAQAAFRAWAGVFGSALLGKEVEFWYNQFLGKPPHNQAPTHWHQDEGYWGRNLADRGITCWIPLQDVDRGNGCMHFIDGSHRDGVLEHERVAGVRSDLLRCAPDEARAVACEIKRGSVTFHHSATVHMTTANDSDFWRKALTQHFQTPDAGGEGDHYPWKVYVDQRTGEVILPR